MIGIIPQEPDNDRCNHYNSSHLTKILFTFIPRMTENSFHCRHTIRRQFHHKRSIITLNQKLAEQTSQQHCQQNTDTVNRKQYQSCIVREESAYQQQINRKTGATGHQRIDKHRYKTAFPVFYGTGSHDSGNITSESHNKRNKRFAVKSHLMHYFIHDKSCTSHISGIFHKGNKEIKDQDVRQKDDHPAYSTNNAIYQHIFQRPLAHMIIDQTP